MTPPAATAAPCACPGCALGSLLDTEAVRVALNFGTTQGVRDAIARGDLPAIQRGRSWWVRRSTLDRLLEIAEAGRLSLAQAMRVLARERRDARRVAR